MTPIHKIIETGALQVNCQLLGNPDTGEALLIDPGGDAELLLQHLARLNLRLTHIINTHGHFDHIGAVAALQKQTEALFLIHEADRFLVTGAPAHAASWGLPFGPVPRIDQTIQDNDKLSVAGLHLEVIGTPGHTPGGVCLRWQEGIAVGDTLFAGSVGRTDLPGGNTEQLIHSIRTRLLTLEDTVVCYPGHGPKTTIGKERRGNPYIR